MNIQEAFNKMVSGLASQNWKQAAADTGVCMYKTPNGSKCAVGHLLPDDGTNWNHFPTISALCISDSMYFEKNTMAKAMKVDLDDPDMADFLISAQTIHDSSGNKNMKDNFIRYADKHDIEFPKEYL